MTKYITLILFYSQLCFGQSFIQYEPEREFYSTIHRSSNSFGTPTTEFAAKHGIKSIAFLRDTVISSVISFDKSGNYLSEIGFENKMVKESVYKWDSKNQITEQRHFKPDGTFYYGYYYSYINGVENKFDIEDSTLVSRNIFLQDENIEIYSTYKETGEIAGKSIVVRDKDLNYLMETRFQNERLYVQYLWDYIEDSVFVSKIQYDQNGSKYYEKKHLDEINNENTILHYTDEGRLFRKDSLINTNQILYFEIYRENGELSRKVEYSYNKTGGITSRIETNYENNSIKKYTVEYDELDRPIKIEKDHNGIIEEFNYVYEYY